MKIKFEESIMTTIILLMSILLFGMPNSNPVKTLVGLVVLWIMGYAILSYDINTGIDNKDV